MRHILLLVLTISLLLFQSCDLYDIGSKNPNVRLPDPTDQTYTTEADITKAYGGTSFFDIGPENALHPICPVRYDAKGTCILVRTDDNCQFTVPTKALSPTFPTSGLKSYNIAFRHYTELSDSTLVGSNISSIMAMWGDYIFAFQGEMDLDGGYVYKFPYVMLLQGDRYLRGVEVYTDPDGVISDIQPVYGIQHNLFSNLPYFDDVLSLNIMQWFMPGPWLGEGHEVPARGFFGSLFYSLLIFGICLVLVSAAGALINLPIDRYVSVISPVTRIVILVAEWIVYYIIIISLIDYYSAAWWITLPLMFGWAVFLPTAAMGLATRDYCPECHGHQWSTSTCISGVKLPTIVFDLRWHGSEPVAEPPRQAEIEIRRKVKRTCLSCGYSSESETSSTELRDRNLCPKCFKTTLTGSFTSHDYDGRTLKAEYLERCTSPGCGYRSRTILNKDIYRRQPMEPSYPHPARNRPSTPGNTQRGCVHCAWSQDKPMAAPGKTCNLGSDRTCEYYYDQTVCPYYRSR